MRDFLTFDALDEDEDLDNLFEEEISRVLHKTFEETSITVILRLDFPESDFESASDGEVSEDRRASFVVTDGRRTCGRENRSRRRDSDFFR